MPPIIAPHLNDSPCRGSRSEEPGIPEMIERMGKGVVGVCEEPDSRVGDAHSGTQLGEVHEPAVHLPHGTGRSSLLKHR